MQANPPTRTQADEYLEHYRTTLASISGVVSTPNRVVSIILSDCVARASEAGIKPTLEIYLGKNFSINAVDLTVLLGNTIENALRALSEVPEDNGRSLHIMLRQRENFLIYEISNKYVPRAKVPARRGYGLRNVRECVKKYHGELKFSENGEVYTVTAILQISG